MRARLLLEEYGPELRYIKGEHNVVADALSRLGLKEQDFSLDAFAFDYDRFPKNYPLSYKQIAYEQQKDKYIQSKLKTMPHAFQLTDYKHSDKTYHVVTDKDNLIVVPKSLQKKCIEWYHSFLMHPGETRLELTLRQYYTWKGMRNDIVTYRKLNLVASAAHPKRTTTSNMASFLQSNHTSYHGTPSALTSSVHITLDMARIKSLCTASP